MGITHINLFKFFFFKSPIHTPLLELDLLVISEDTRVLDLLLISQDTRVRMKEEIEQKVIGFKRSILFIDYLHWIRFDLETSRL